MLASLWRMIVWRLKNTMDRLNVSRYALAKTSGITINTIRSMYAGAPQRTDFRVIDQVIVTLRELTGADVTLADVLVWEENPPKA